MIKAKLNSIFRHGRLTVVLPGTQVLRFGGADASEPGIVVRLKGNAPVKIAFSPDRYVGEAYMDGDLVMERGTIYDLLDLAGSNLAALPQTYPGLIRTALYKARAAVQQANDQRRARRNVAHHYDISNDLYRMFLDADMQYSCAFFAEPGMTLEDAQVAKKRHIAAKLLLQPGQSVLDIGCGWGGLAISLAQAAAVDVLGVTLAQAQLTVARDRAAALGLGHRVRFELRDYRTLEGRFDRIVSVGMFEHVGTPQYRTYFNTIRRLLAPDGVALVHSIGRNHGITVTNPWINKYIFPGGYIPSLSEVMPPVEASGLWLTDLEVLRLHYAETCRHWRERFMARKHTLGPGYDERFCRMWEFYLASSEMSFRHGGLMVFQAQLSRSIDAVPLTRDYIVDSERMAPLSRAKAE